tara:strand:- start:3375 stop:3626 length:252 start_codon:yes stop_codon:yes gene_type:complete
MDVVTCNNSTNIYIALMIMFPLCWGIYEIKKFREQFNDFKLTTDKFLKKVDDITNNKLDNYPFINDCKKFVDKFNSFFSKRKK